MTVNFYPGASRAYDYSSRYQGDVIKPNCGVIHTTEGTSLPSYGQGAAAPNITARPNFAKKRLDFYQHYAFNRSARALVNLAGGVETNTCNCVQIELVGTCDPKHKKTWNGAKAGKDYVYWPDAPEWALDGLATFMAWQYKNNGIPLTGPSTWLAYPSSYGKTKARMSFAAWNAFRGWCGHAHVPENVHGDPGDIDFAKLLSLAKTKAKVSSGGAGKPKPKPPFPGVSYFGPGKNNAHITLLGQQLVKKGFGRHYASGPGPKWSDADRKNVAAFQRSRKELAGDPDGLPGPLTWRILFS
ncbi:peptidoglycan-binding protein [Streptomyces sp. NBC_01433]|uniref:peptidoglycan-binding protein n=1 Tax=Streptomyces sp. NBC_01433 TaxID=2903864 RepID=UPI00225568A4|nr:peptidoglycan-binding protein [Streptomyces sp. NBC_01433]MCX4677585.1 peptidoglycan-binding protein [Streptomyces sp. NBC_01433]